MISSRLVSALYLLVQVITSTELPTGKVINGSFASILEYPHNAFVAVFGLTKGEESPIALGAFGGAVLINAYWLLSAAHMMLDNERLTGGRPIFKIILGVDDLTQTGLVADVELYRCHPRFAPHEPYFPYDICLVKTREMIQFSDRVRPVALPKREEELDFIFKLVKFTGFGRTYDPEDRFEHLRLREVDMEVLYPMFCSLAYDWHGSLPVFCTTRWYNSSDDRIIVGAISSGDSGSGLVATRNSTGKFVLLGICSFSELETEDAKDKPIRDYYARVSYMIDWIFENMC